MSLKDRQEAFSEIAPKKKKTEFEKNSSNVSDLARFANGPIKTAKVIGKKFIDMTANPIKPNPRVQELAKKATRVITGEAAHEAGVKLHKKLFKR